MPTATTTMSASRHAAGVSFVKMWHNRTVALRSVSSSDNGRPTIRLAPTTVTSAPCKGTHVESISSTTAKAVQGAMMVWP